MLYAIGDLHLGMGLIKGKPMDIFGADWTDHHLKIKKNWTDKITENDTVIIPGDLSWAMNEKEFSYDAAFIHKLSGNKIIINGNHDYWWGSTSKLNAMYPDIFFLKNSFSRYGNFHICGTRGWLCPNDSRFTEHDFKIYNREVNRLKLSLDSAMNDGAEQIIVLLHYPPFNDNKETSDFIKMIKEYPVNNVIYGHLHGDSCRTAICGKQDGINYHLASADFIKFNPIKILD